MANGWRRRAGAVIGLLAILLVAMLFVGAGPAAFLVSTLGGSTAAVEQRAEADDVTIRRCERDSTGMVALVGIANDTAAASSYFVDVQFVARWSGGVAETVALVIEDLPADAWRRLPVESTVPGPRLFDCRIGDVDRLAS